LLGFSEGRFQRIKLILEEVNEFRSSTGDLQSAKIKNSQQIETALPFQALADEDGASPSAYSTWLGCVLRLCAEETSLREQFFKDLKVANLIQRHNPLILSYWMSSLDLIKSELVLKVPHAYYQEVLEQLSKKSFRLSQFVLLSVKDNFQICGFDSCQLVTKNANEFWQGLDKFQDKEEALLHV